MGTPSPCQLKVLLKKRMYNLNPAVWEWASTGSHEQGLTVGNEALGDQRREAEGKPGASFVRAGDRGVEGLSCVTSRREAGVFWAQSLPGKAHVFELSGGDILGL